ncbi:hypothetical protein HYX01_00625 [Candidatus Woesearchaeota archaeon]|nr:hypothetical protein [Candidatus Woesearchaeota archaeon]
MKGFLITHKGMEDIASLELKEILGRNSEINETCVIFDIKKYDELFKLCYKSQSSIGIYFLLCQFEFDELFNDFEKNINDADFNKWLDKNSSFAVKCRKDSLMPLPPTPEIEKKLGELIINRIEKKHGYKQKVNLENPDISIFAYIKEKKVYVGIDFAGFDLSIRQYNIFKHPAAIKSTIAYCLIRLSEYNKKHALLDCFAGCGTIPLEAALFASSLSINFFNKEKLNFTKFGRFKDYDFKGFFEKIDSEANNDTLKIYNFEPSMKYLQYAKKNCKIAGIDKKINFSRMDIEWLDTKFENGKIDKIATAFPLFDKKDADKIYREFFYQSDFILAKNGVIAISGNKEMIEKHASKYKFMIAAQRKILSGKREHEIFILCR